MLAPQQEIEADAEPARPIPRVAYFSMEIALESDVPTYSGGLGILAGDMLLSAADLRIPIVAVTMVHKQGYFVQTLERGQQHELPDSWDPRKKTNRVDPVVSVEIEGRDVKVGAWCYDLIGTTGAVVPVLLLDTDLEENSADDRALVGSLYGGDDRYRLAQEIILGYGGYAILEALGYANGIATYHMNEGHSALLVAAAMERRLAARGAHDVTPEDVAALRPRFVFTTHTPVPAGHDRFHSDLARHVLGDRRVRLVEQIGAMHDGLLNMSYLALSGSHYTNGVAMRHGEVSRELFNDVDIHAITNGVHAGRWTAPAFAALFDRRIPGWKNDNAYLRHAVGIPTHEVADAHRETKSDLLNMIAERTGVELDPTCFTIGFARRAAGYKRGALVFHDLDRLRSIAKHAGPMQFVFGGKSHPRDQEGKAVIRRIYEAALELGDAVRVVYIENYEMAVAALIVAGVDVWLNNPRAPLEASGTSGMKAALNGIPSLSTIDGWWVDVADLYDKLERVVMPMYYRDPDAYARVRRNAIALNGSYFNTQRMVEQYALGAYGLVSNAARS
jgi:starch phosphorylase